VSVAEPIEATADDTNQRVASGSSFYAAMRILPRAQREGMFQIYAFCRQVDDIADDDGPRAGRFERLQQWRADIEAIYAGQPGERVAALARSVAAFGLDKQDFLAVIDGMEMDVTTTIVAPDLATLDLYCDRVASAVGRLSVKVFGMPHDDGRQLAHHLGRALQLTNILRDIDEDAAIGRVYLPRETLATAGLAAPTPALVRDAALDAACAPLVEQARAHFRASWALMAHRPRRMVVAPRLMAHVYGAILDKLVARGFAPPRAAVRVSRPRLLAALLRYMLF
jgi:squalene synthase HpnD